MKNSRLILFFCCSFLFLSATQATKRNISDAATLNSQYALSADGDTLNFTAHIVVSSAFTVAKSIVFEGNGYTITVTRPGLNDAGVRHSSPSAFRVFDLSGTKTIVFNHLTIKGGRTTSTGGAVSIASITTAKFNYSVISNSESTAGGGGIYNAGNCYLYKSFVTRNIGSYGGGIYNNAGKLFMEYSTVTENRTSTSNGGGGIENHSSGYLYIHNSSFSNNQCGGGAGAINNYGGYAFLINSSFTGNVSLAYPGGAIYQDNTGSAGRDLIAINCLFAYNYYTTGGYTAASYTLNDVNVVNGTANLYYCIYMSNTTLTHLGAASPGVLNYAIGNTAHPLNGDGSTNDLLTGGSLTGVMNGNGQVLGTGKVFQPLLVNINGQRVPTLRSSSFALAKGCNTRFTNGSGTPVIAYKNMGTSAWVNIAGSSTAGMEITNDQTHFNRAATPAASAVERTVDDYVILTVRYSANGTADGGSVYGEAYPSGTPVTVTAIPNSGYAFANWTKDSSSSVTSSTETGNPFTISPMVNTSLTPNFSATTNFSIMYLDNGSSSGTVPSISSHTSGSTASIAANSGNLLKTNFTFSGWNTADNGSGTDYTPGSGTYTGVAGSNLILYAKWQSTGAVLILPVKLISFHAFATGPGDRVELHWKAAAEINSSHYEVQRSDNGQDWVPVGRVNSAGNSSTAASYLYIDQQPLKPISYYRLKMLDTDGSFTYSPVRKITIGNTGSLCVYPNPARDHLFIIAPGINPDRARIYNSAGADVTGQCRISPVNSYQLQVLPGILPRGLYFIRIAEQSQSFLLVGQ